MATICDRCGKAGAVPCIVPLRLSDQRGYGSTARVPDDAHETDLCKECRDDYTTLLRRFTLHRHDAPLGVPHPLPASFQPASPLNGELRRPADPLWPGAVIRPFSSTSPAG